MVKKIIFILGVLLVFSSIALADANPVLLFSDIESGPGSGVGDGLGEGAIVTIWGQHLGDKQADSRIIFTDSASNEWDIDTYSHVYYWCKADGGTSGGGPANLYESHFMQEIAFSIPTEAASGMGEIKVVVDGVVSNTLPFTVRSGEIWYVKTTGDDSTCSAGWNTPCLTVGYDTAGAASKVSDGDIIYVCDGVTSGTISIREGNDGTATRPISIVAYPGADFLVDTDNNGIEFENYQASSTSGAEYWNFSKIRFETEKSGAQGCHGSRMIGLSITDGVCADGAGGGIVTTGRHGAQKVFGNYIFNFGGSCTNTGLHHSTYFTPWFDTESPEVAYNYLKNNEVGTGLHFYTQSDRAKFTTPLNVYKNVVINQVGLGMDVQGSNHFDMDINIWGNLLVNTGLDATRVFVLLGGSGFTSSFKIYNNTFYGDDPSTQYLSEVSWSFGGDIEWRNNVVVTTHSANFWNGTTPTTHTNSAWYDTNGVSTAPSWDTTPKITNPNLDSYYALNEGSDLNDAGYDTSSIVGSVDLYGYPWGTMDIGAIGNGCLLSDEDAPTITSVYSDKINGSYTTGEVIDIQITFSEAVSSIGDVTVTLKVGDTDRTCTFQVANSSTATCYYTVQSGDSSSDLTVFDISGIIEDGSGNDMTNFTPTTNLSDNKDLVIHTEISVDSLADADPVLLFSDIESGPGSGVGDGLGEGAIVTIWGQHLGDTQADSTIIFTDSASNEWDIDTYSHVYYWCKADGGTSGGGPANLYESHFMQEIAFSIPTEAASGMGEINVVVDGVVSNTLPFTVRSGEIWYVKTTGDDSTCSAGWNTPCLTVGYDTAGAASKVSNGDIIYVCDGVTSDTIYIREGNDGTATRPISIVAYPGADFLVDTDNNGIEFENYQASSTSGAEYWNFSKIRFETEKSGAQGCHGSRMIGLSITDGVCADGAGGGIVTTGRHGAQKVFGNYIFNFGGSLTKTASHHSTCFTPWFDTESPEVAYNYLKNNEVGTGFHFYTQSDRAKFTTPLNVYKNVVVNQVGLGMNVQGSNHFDMDINIWGNLFVNTGLDTTRVFVLSGGSGFTSQFKIYNNTFYGDDPSTQYLSEVSWSFGGDIEWCNNVVVSTHSANFWNGTKPYTHTNNAWYDTNGVSTAPSWDTTPKITNPNLDSYYALNVDSDLIDAGYDTSSIVGLVDLYGYLWGTMDIGAIGDGYILRFIAD